MESGVELTVLGFGQMLAFDVGAGGLAGRAFPCSVMSCPQICLACYSPVVSQVSSQRLSAAGRTCGRSRSALPSAATGAVLWAYHDTFAFTGYASISVA